MQEIPKIVSQNVQLDDFIGRIQEVFIESWYKPLQHLTFQSYFIPLTVQDAKALLENYKYKKGKTRSLLESHQTLLNSLAFKISEYISKCNSQAFVKTSFRSPKDATLLGQKTKDLYLIELDKMETRDSNEKLIAYMTASGKSLKVLSGNEAINLLTTSERIFEDMELALETPNKFQNGLIIREWIDIPLELEFRGFVYGRKLTAVSQYFHPLYFPSLLTKQELLSQRIQDFYYNQVLEKLNVDNCIIDFAISQDDRVLVIELNPFNDYEGCGTDPCLFDWKKDQNILVGKEPFEFRVRKSPREDVDSLVKECLRNLDL